MVVLYLSRLLNLERLLGDGYLRFFFDPSPKRASNYSHLSYDLDDMQSRGKEMDCSFSDTESLSSALSTPRSWSLSPPSSPYYSEISETGATESIDGDIKGKQRTRAGLGKLQDPLQEIRERRNAFFLAHGDVIAPLLGEGISLSKLLQIKDHTESRPISFENIKLQPHGIKGCLKPYQLEGLSFLVNLKENGVGGILADEMGLGKTFQTLSLFQFLKENDDVDRAIHAPFLVVCPLSVLDTWIAEITRWTPELRAVKYHGTSEQRTNVKESLKAQKSPNGSAQLKDMVDIVVTTYDTLLSEIIWFSRAFVWRYAVLDECHRIKDCRSKRASVLGRLKSEYKLVLSGTPIQNDLAELWSIFHWLYPDIFVPSSEKLFVQAFSLKDGKFDSVFIDNVKKFLELIMIRRTKETPGIGLNIPPKTELVLSVPLTKVQYSWYMRILTGAAEESSNVPERSSLSFCRHSSSESSDYETSIATEHEFAAEQNSENRENKAYRVTGNILMELRQCCIHPYLLKDAIPDPYILGDHVFNTSGKFIALQKLLKHYLEVEHTKVIIFSNFEQTLNLCEDLLTIMQGDSPAVEYLRLDGRTTSPWRKLMVHLFQNNARYMVFLLSIRAGGEGLNLTSSSVVIFLDEDWNPQVMKQAESRVHRIGQSRPVQIYKLRSSGTVEEQMTQRIAKKAYIATKITENMHTFRPVEGTDSFDVSIGSTDLPSPLFWNTNALPQSQLDSEEMLQWHLKDLLKRCVKQSSCARESEVFTAEQEHSWLHKAEKVRTDLFNGISIDTTGRHRSIYAREMTINLSRYERRIGKERVVIIDGYEVSKESLDPVAVEEPVAKNDKPKSPQGRLVHELTCFLCRQFGPINCDKCPRAFHIECLERITEEEEYSEGLICPHHYCFDCGKSASQAGGLLFSCRECVKAYCEQCLNWGATIFIGIDPAVEGMGYFPQNAFCIECVSCRPSLKRNQEVEIQLDPRKRQRLQGC